MKYRIKKTIGVAVWLGLLVNTLAIPQLHIESRDTAKTVVLLNYGLDDPDDLFDLYVSASESPTEWRRVACIGEQVSDSQRKFTIPGALVPPNSGLFVAGNRKDSDGDGVSDGAEVLIKKTSPQIPNEFTGELVEMERLIKNPSFAKSGAVIPIPVKLMPTSADISVLFTTSKGKLSADSNATGTSNEVTVTASNGVAVCYLSVFFDSKESEPDIIHVKATITESEIPKSIDFLVYEQLTADITGGEHLVAPYSPESYPLDYWAPKTDNNGASIGFLSSESSIPTAGILQDCLPVVGFDGINDRMQFTAGSATATTTIVALYKPESPHQVHSPSIHYGERHAGLSGQRYLVAGAVKLGADPWPDPTGAAPELEFSVWRNFKYTEEWTPTFDLLKAYDSTTLPSLMTHRSSPTIPAERRFDGTANGLYDKNMTTAVKDRLKPQAPLSAYDIVEKNIEKFGAAGWEWDIESILPAVDVTYVKQMDLPLIAPDYTARHDGGKAVEFEERFYKFKGTTYLHPDRNSDSLVESPSTVSTGLSAGNNGLGVFTFRDGNSDVAAQDRNKDEYYASLLRLDDGGNGWRVAVVSIARDSQTAISYSMNSIRSATGINSKATALTEIEYIGGSDPLLPGNYFHGYLAELIVFSSSQSGSTLRDIADSLGFKASLEWDRNNNSMPDPWEFAYLASRRTVGGWTSTADPDGDTLTNLQEFNGGTHPLRKDSDGDGLDDNVEATLGLNPTSADTDGDGIPDNIDTSHCPD
jgi:hypothetical protein